MAHLAEAPPSADTRPGPGRPQTWDRPPTAPSEEGERFAGGDVLCRPGGEPCRCQSPELAVEVIGGADQRRSQRSISRGPRRARTLTPLARPTRPRFARAACISQDRATHLLGAASRGAGPDGRRLLHRRLGRELAASASAPCHRGAAAVSPLRTPSRAARVGDCGSGPRWGGLAPFSTTLERFRSTGRAGGNPRHFELLRSRGDHRRDVQGRARLRGRSP